MFRNYLFTALRNLSKHRLFAAINIGGLAVGLAAVILIGLFVKDELSWDRWIPDSNRIYRVELTSFPVGREKIELAVTMTPFQPFFAQDFREVEQATRLRYDNRTITRGGQYFSEQPAFVDPNFFDVFDLPFVTGNAAEAMRDTSSVVISRDTARKYFGQEEALGQALELDNGRSYRVTGVFENLPSNSHFKLDVVFPMTYAEFPTTDSGPSMLDEWFDLGTYTYLKLDQPAGAAVVQAGMPVFLDAHGPRPNDSIVPSERWNMTLVGLTDLHLEGAPLARIKAKGSKGTIFAFATIAGLVLLIACFNFVNLSTARATLRSKEVALRKVMGAARHQLVVQFLAEAVVTVTLALVLALGIVEMALPFYNEFVQKILKVDLGGDPMMSAALAGLLIVVALGAGSHPALMISRFRPAAVLKSGGAESRGSVRIRTALVVIQFAIAAGLIVAGLVIYSQVRYGISRDLGFEHDNALVLDKIYDPKVLAKTEVLKERLLAHPNVYAAAYSSVVPADSGVGLTGYGQINGVSVEPIIVNLMSIDAEFFGAYGIDIIAGRDFDRARETDYQRRRGGTYRDSGIIINETAMRRLGFATYDEAVGSTLQDDNTATIIGVVTDIHTGSARQDINPFVYVIDEEYFGRLTLRFRTEDVAKMLTEIDTIWADVVPEVPISRTFLNDRIAGQYEADQARGLMFTVFATLAALVASLGLYGLASFTIERRTKEIGIRKAHGATVADLVKLLIFQFSKPVLMANLIAWPVTFYFLHGWLESFVYRIDLSLTPFLISGAAALIIAWITIAGHAIRIARTNPVHALRYE